MRLLAGALLLAALTACGTAEPEAAPGAQATTQVQTTTGSPDATMTTEPESTTETTAEAAEVSAEDVPVELQAQIVANAVNESFAEVREPLLEALKTDAEVEAVEGFAFDVETSTLTLDMTSIYDSSEEAMTGAAYRVATSLAPLMWTPELASRVTDAVALPTFDMEMNQLRFVCDGAAMAALADTALSQESFVERCQQ